MKCIKMIFFLWLPVFFIQCAHTHNVPLDPDYSTQIQLNSPLSSIEPAIIFQKGNFEDKRADTTKLAKFKQGIHTYNLYPKRKMDDTLFEGIKALLEKSGHQFTTEQTSKISVDLQLLNFSASRNAGFINVGASTSIQVKVDFVDSKTGKIIYSQVYNGVDDREQALVGLMGMVNASINASIVNCINNIGQDASLKKAIQDYLSQPNV